jgi:hypothetical protein
MRRDLKNPMAPTFNDGGDPPKSMFAVPKINATASSEGGVGNNARLQSSMSKNPSNWAIPKGDATKGANPRSIQSTLETINEMRKSGDVSQKESVVMKKQLLGEGGYKDKYEATPMYKAGKAVSAAASSVKKAAKNCGKSFGPSMTAETRSGSCTGHNTDF